MNGQHERLGFRIERDHRRLIEQAARLEGRTVREFAVSTLVRAARAAVEAATTTVLSARDRDVIMQMLSTEGGPNAALERAAGRYKARRGGVRPGSPDHKELGKRGRSRRG